jgi:hypothetical protein
MSSSPSWAPIARTAPVFGALAWAGAPWWSITFAIAATLSLGLVEATFPQESSDRLAWWRERRGFGIRDEDR